MTPRPLLLSVLLMASALVGCPDPDVTSDPATAGDTAAGQVTSPTQTPTQTQTQPSAPRQTGTPVDPPDDTTTADSASGSGCTPSPGPDLPDGRWYGYLDDTEPAKDELSFDLACWFTGDAAIIAASEDGAESPPPNDYHIRNDNDRLRSLAVTADAVVNWLPDTGDPASMEPVSLADWLARRGERAHLPGVWVDIANGVVVAVEEQYVP